MKIKTKKWIFTICICLLILAIGITFIYRLIAPNMPYDYPDYFTPEYIQESYNITIPNIFFTKWSINGMTGPEVKTANPSKAYKIEGIELTDFIYFHNQGMALLHDPSSVILRHKDSSFDPARNGEINQVYLVRAYAQNFPKCGKGNAGRPSINQYLKNSEKILVSPSSSTLLFAAYDEIIKAIRSEALVQTVQYSEYVPSYMEGFDATSRALMNSNPRYHVTDLSNFNSTDYSIAITFTQYPTLIFLASIAEEEEKYYLCLRTMTQCDPEDFAWNRIGGLVSNYYYYYVGENFDTFMADVITQQN